jgi:Fe-S oxidoreductase
MAKPSFEIPTLSRYPEIPPITPGAMAHCQPYRSKPEYQAQLGFPGELVPDWQRRAVEKMGELLSQNRSLRVFLEACVKCGKCTDKCHFFLGTQDPNNMPAGRQELMRKVYRRYFTPAGRLFPKLVGAVDFTEALLDDWYSYFHQCSQCRRCSVYCPFGIDTAEISMAAREIMNSIGVGQKYCNEIIGKVHKIGNNLGIPGRALVDTLEGLEEDVFAETGVGVRYPIDQVGAEVLMITPSADFFAEPHVDGLIGYGKVFHAAGVSWTLSSYASEAANFGLFIGSNENMQRLALRIREAAIQLKVRRIVFGECGHAWRVAYNFLNTLAGPWDFLDHRFPVPQHICEFTYDLIQQGQLTLDKSQNDDKVLTYHDSCNVARASRMGDTAGGQFEIPRAIIRATCNHFHDMEEESIRGRTFCCGGGGGLLTDELIELRTKGAKPRMAALNTVIQEQGVTHLVSICAICKSQFTRVLPLYGIGMDRVLSLHHLVSTAIVL